MDVLHHAPTPIFPALEADQPVITPGPKLGSRFRGFERRQDTCEAGRTQCGAAGCPYDCCDAAAKWGCSLSGEKCFTASGYVGCCASGSSCNPRTTCYDYPSGNYCDKDTGGCTICNSAYPYCITEINAYNSNYILYCGQQSAGTITVTGDASSQITPVSTFNSLSSESLLSDSYSALQTSTSASSIPGTITIGTPETSASSTAAVPFATITIISTTSTAASPVLSAAAVAGISIGGFFALGMLTLAGFYLCCRRRREEKFHRNGPPIVPAPDSEVSNNTSVTYTPSMAAGYTDGPAAGGRGRGGRGQGYVGPQGFNRPMAQGYYGYTEQTGERQYSELDGWGIKRSGEREQR